MRMRDAPGKWYVRLDGKTLGPLSTAELQSGLEDYEFNQDDKASRAPGRVWRPLREYSDFLEVCTRRIALRKKVEAPPPVGSLIAKRRERRELQERENKERLERERAKAFGKDLPVRPPLQSFEPPAPPRKAGGKNQAFALAQMVQELREQSTLKFEIRALPISLPKKLNPLQKQLLFLLSVLLGASAIHLATRSPTFSAITKGLKSSRSSAPPAPTSGVSGNSDPIYLPKSPVRPKRN